MARKTKADALKTRQALIEAAIQQFAERGVASTTLTDIADAAGVTRGAIYWHFTSKTELFNEMWEQQIPLRDIIKHQLTHIENNDPLQSLRERLITSLRYVAETPKQQALMQILYHKCEFYPGMIAESEIRKKICFSREEFRATLQECIHRGILSADINIDIVLVIFQGFFSGIIKNWLMDPEQINLYQQAPLLVDNIMATLNVQPLNVAGHPRIAC
jgi:TetR/AcrR family transcriptional repressor of acrEF/envCD operon